ncbi:BON domain-containing protein [Aquincola sp. S2]|uniref:BON domain-containing protein n=1 Tax=Pseudaquabacterium terrae TaxID=2732868 RepID=A0ABX2ET31_9BURK|nr:BON domain-containing protein [Aquabacterium terrae]NRF71589.1 BON domain-containing protein [Aquabacterium terrae]
MNARTPRTPLLSALCAAALTLGLAACDRPDQTARDDTAAGQVAQKADEAQGAINDAAITASVNARLARDNELSAMRIDVDTVGGKVALKGTAPNDSARERATQLAQAVDGVRSVDNQLAIG